MPLQIIIKCNNSYKGKTRHLHFDRVTLLSGVPITLSAPHAKILQDKKLLGSPLWQPLRIGRRSVSAGDQKDCRRPSNALSVNLIAAPLVQDSCLTRMADGCSRINSSLVTKLTHPRRTLFHYQYPMGSPFAFQPFYAPSLEIPYMNPGAMRWVAGWPFYSISEPGARAMGFLRPARENGTRVGAQTLADIQSPKRQRGGPLENANTSWHGKNPLSRRAVIGALIRV